MAGRFLCISCYFKGVDFLRACREAGNKVHLVTSKALEHEAWPRDVLEEIHYMEAGEQGQWNHDHLLAGLAYVMRSTPFDRVIALDDFDVERAALVREHFRLPGMGQTTARHFRDKLAMRMKAAEAGIRVPAFSPLFSDEQIDRFADRISPPWFVKPRSEASATGIHKVDDKQSLWTVLDRLGDARHHHLIEAFVQGDVFHVDSLSYGGDNVFSRTSRYLDTPFEVAHGGGIFRTMTLPSDSAEDRDLRILNQQLMQVFGMQHSASHSEYIRSQDSGEYYFLETSSRVGGAHIAEMVEAASGINLWREWAMLETRQLLGESYQLPSTEEYTAGAIISLSKFEHPDDQSFDDPEIYWRMKKDYHIGFILRSQDSGRVQALLDQYAERIAREYHASAPAPDRPTH